MICGYDSSSGKLDIAPSGSIKRLLDSLEPVKDDPSLWHQHEVASCAEIVG